LRRAYHLSNSLSQWWARFALPTLRFERLPQSFLNTIDAIHPVISAMKAVISP
jgi:hypothetical protein